MIYSRKNHQYQIVQQILTPESNPTLWTDDILNTMLNGEVIIGYLFRSKVGKFNVPIHILNLYTIDKKYLRNQNKIINNDTLTNTFVQWLDSLAEDAKSIMFRNPPVHEWMETKENWCKKLAHKLSVKYNKTYDDCLSSVYATVMKCYSKPHVYMGNLSYIEIAAHNDIKMQIRYMKNRLTGDHPLMISLDADVSEHDNGEDSVMKFQELIGKLDPFHEELDFNCLKQEIIDDLSEVFTPREIDQIINAPGYLTMYLYRKLNKWRKTHKRGDYDV